MTTNTIPSTASQAPASISDCQEYRNAKAVYRTAVYGDLAQASADLDSCIDTKRAQEREEAIGTLAIAFEKMLCAAVGRDWSTSGISASSLVEELRSRTEKAESRATAAEAKLEAIRQGIEGLKRYLPSVGYPGRLFEEESGIAFKCDDVLALFTTPPKADESGLPG